MLKSLVSTIFVVCTLFVHAQEFSVGLKGGFHTLSIGEINSRGGSIQGNPPDVVFQPVTDIGFQFGTYLTVEFGALFFRPELNYYASKNHYDFPDKRSYWKNSHIDFPLLAGYRIFDPISIYAGPGFNFYSETTLDGVQVTGFSDGGPDLKRSTMGLNIGAMIKWKRLAVDIRYEIGFHEYEEELLDIVNSTYGVNLADRRSYKSNVLSLNLMVDILRTNDDDIGGFFSGLFRSNKCYCPY